MGREQWEDHQVKPKNCTASSDDAQSKDLATVEQPIYQIRVKGHLGHKSADWFEGLAIHQEKGGTTVLTGPLADQAALHGLLVKIRNLCLPLISVNRVARPPRDSDQVSAEE